MRGILIAGALAFLLSFFLTPLFIKFLARRGYGQQIRDDGPKTHHVKRGTPTMGGAIALRRDDVGHLSIGARANFALINAPSYIHLAYRPGVPLISTTWKDGNVIFTKGDIA
ncbi:MAG: hypothetical protein EB045_04505 [Actinobacteria bacterium]|nr:hypothetical protein [Actinomycetota bacterium]